MMSQPFKIHPAAPASDIAATVPARRSSWRGMLAVALVAGAAGIIGGMQLRGSPPPSAPAPAPAMAAMPGMDHAPKAPAGTDPHAVYISPARQQLIGVRSAEVVHQHIAGTLRTVGMLAYDETRTAQVHTRVSGWVEQLYVNYVGKPVRRGQALFAVYSPELATAQADFLAALETGSADLVRASRERMRRWSISDAQIDTLERTRQASRTLAIESPFDGVVLEKDAFAGQYVTPEMTSYKLADLSNLWAVGQVFEYEAARLHVGDAVDVEFPYGQAASRTAKIDFIYPEVDPQTRRVRFRVALDNRDGKLKPDTYVNLIWHGDAQHVLAVPKEAVIDTGPRKYVLLALANGYFAAHDVQLGPAIGEFYPVLDGLAHGDRVVTSAQFLIDSETNLMSAMQGMAMSMPGMDMGTGTGSGSAAPMDDMPGM